MYENLLSLLEHRPHPYEKGEDLFWDDPHISQQMLKAHPYACIKRDRVYDNTSDYLEQYLIIEDDAYTCYNLWNHAFTRNEIQDLVREAGFSEVEFFADVAGSPFHEDSPTVCVVARKR